MLMSTSAVTRECTVARKMMPVRATRAAEANMYFRLRRRARKWESWAGVAIVDDGEDVSGDEARIKDADVLVTKERGRESVG